MTISPVSPSRQTIEPAPATKTVSISPTNTHGKVDRILATGRGRGREGVRLEEVH